MKLLWFLGFVCLVGFVTTSEAASVRDFGAVGDGVTNDTVAVQAAIDAAGFVGGGLVTLPAGVYLVDPLSLRTGVALIGDGIGATVVRLRPSAEQHNDAIHILGLERVTIRAMTIDVDGSHQLTQGSEGTRGIQIGASALVVIEGLEVVRSAGAGIKVSSGTDVKITNCTVTYAGTTGMPAPGIEVGASNSLVRDVLIANNRVAYSTQEGISIRAGGGSGNTKGVVITGNVLTNNNQIGYTKGALTVTLQSENVTISNNIIQLDAAKANSFGLYIQTMLAGIVVSNNIIQTTAPGHVGITAQDLVGGSSRGVTFSGNVVRGPGLGIQVSPYSAVSVIGNDFTALTGAVRAIFRTPTAPGLYVTGNAGL